MKTIKVKRSVGSNQYKVRETSNFVKYVRFIIGCAIILALFKLFLDYYNDVPKLISPIVKFEVKRAYAVENHETTQMESIKMIISAFEGFGPKVVMQALKIAECESNFRETARGVNKNGSTDTGIFQINSIHGYDETKLYASAENIDIAKAMYIRNGKHWGPWVCARKLGIK